MRISKELQEQREAFRTQTKIKATALLQEVEKERQAAAAKGDFPLVQFMQTQIRTLADASAAADFEAVERFRLAWEKRKNDMLSEAEKAAKARAPISNPEEILNKARRTQAHGRKELDRLERERIAKLKGE